jgi:hypothetical protein
MKNRKRETCTSGTVRDEDGNILIYSAGSAIRSLIWTKIMSALAGAHDAAVQMIDTSIVRVHQHVACVTISLEVGNNAACRPWL